jgi:hypothetical protein
MMKRGEGRSSNTVLNADRGVPSPLPVNHSDKETGMKKSKKKVRKSKRIVSFLRRRINQFYRFQKDTLGFIRYKIIADGWHNGERTYAADVMASGGYLIKRRFVGLAFELENFMFDKQEAINETIPKEVA